MKNTDRIFIDCVGSFKSKMIKNNVNSGKEIEEAVRLAYKDLQWRTIKGHTNVNKNNNIQNIKTHAENYLNGQIKEYFDLISKINGIFQSDNGIPKTYKTQSFGKAQKVVNMTFKYLYCLDYKPNGKNIDFSKVDIPLDDFILDFYYEKVAKTKSKKNISWSNIGENDYKNIQNEFKSYINKVNPFKGLKPIEAEFLIFNYEQSKAVKVAFQKLEKKFKAVPNHDKEIYKEISGKNY